MELTLQFVYCELLHPRVAGLMALPYAVLLHISPTSEDARGGGSLLADICSLKEYDSSLPQRLMEWFEEFFEYVVGTETVDTCNATPGSGKPEDALDWKGLHAWPFLLCASKTLHAFLKVPGMPTSSHLLGFPCRAFPQRNDLGEETKER
jgi:hypothetical protein